MEKLEGGLFFIGPERTFETGESREVNREGTEPGAAKTRGYVQRQQVSRC